MVCTDGLDAVRALLSCVQADGAQSSDALLEEKNEAKLKKLCISELKPGMLLLSTDEGHKQGGAAICMSPLFATDGKFEQNRACDAVLLRKADDGYHVCYIELKSDAPSGFEGQFKSTECFMHYVKHLALSLCQQPIEITRSRFVVFHTDSQDGTRRGSKQKIRFSPKVANTQAHPDKFCVRNGDTVRCTEFF